MPSANEREKERWETWDLSFYDLVTINPEQFTVELKIENGENDGNAEQRR